MVDVSPYFWPGALLGGAVCWGPPSVCPGWAGQAAQGRSGAIRFNSLRELGTCFDMAAQEARALSHREDSGKHIVPGRRP